MLTCIEPGIYLLSNITALVSFTHKPHCVKCMHCFLKEDAVAGTSRAGPDLARSAAAFAISIREQGHLSQVNLARWTDALGLMI